MPAFVSTPDFKYHIVCAHSYPEFGIGSNGKLSWTLKGDLQQFKSITVSSSPSKFNFVVMGRTTYDSLPHTVRPLPNRFNIVITRDEFLLANNADPNINQHNNRYVRYTKWDKLQETLANVFNEYSVNTTQQTITLSHDVFIIGGEEIYKLALNTLNISTAYITEVYVNEKKKVETFDKFFPNYDTTTWNYGEKNAQLSLFSVSKFHNEHGIAYRYLIYKSNVPPGYTWKSEEELQYLHIMNDILERGDERIDRTNVGTVSLFHTVQKYDLSDTFPLCTTKRMFFRAIFEELALYLSGKTDNKILQDKGIHIWDGNTNRDFLDKRGLMHYPEGDMGETYGFNFRHYGAKYTTCKDEHPLDGTVGYDQVSNIINLLKTDPASRRMIINLWNPATQHNAALPACLMLYQFHVNMQRKTLNCQLYLRSSDYFLANNWNVCTGALFVHMLCNLEGIDLVPGELIIVTGDTHIYKSHLAQVRENLGRKPYPFPALEIKGGKKKNITDFKFDDLRLVGYKAHPSISAEMAV